MFKRYFNANTLEGRANVAKATYGSFLMGYLYYRMRSRTKQPQILCPQLNCPDVHCPDVNCTEKAVASTAHESTAAKASLSLNSSKTIANDSERGNAESKTEDKGTRAANTTDNEKRCRCGENAADQDSSSAAYYGARKIDDDGPKSADKGSCYDDDNGDSNGYYRSKNKDHFGITKEEYYAAINSSD